MYDGYINAAKEVFGKRVKVTADRFHAAKLYKAGVESLRKKEMKRLKDELSEEEYKELKGVMWILRRKPKDLNDEQREILEILWLSGNSCCYANIEYPFKSSVIL